MVLMYIRYVYHCLHQKSFGIGTHSSFSFTCVNQQGIKDSVTIEVVKVAGEFIVNKIPLLIAEEMMNVYRSAILALLQIVETIISVSVTVDSSGNILIQSYTYMMFYTFYYLVLAMVTHLANVAILIGEAIHVNSQPAEDRKRLAIRFANMHFSIFLAVVSYLAMRYLLAGPSYRNYRFNAKTTELGKFTRFAPGLSKFTEFLIVKGALTKEMTAIFALLAIGQFITGLFTSLLPLNHGDFNIVGDLFFNTGVIGLIAGFTVGTVAGSFPITNGAASKVQRSRTHRLLANAVPFLLLSVIHLAMGVWFAIQALV